MYSDKVDHMSETGNVLASSEQTDVCDVSIRVFVY